MPETGIVQESAQKSLDSLAKELEELEIVQFEEDDSSQIPPTDIVAYNELRSCADIFRMYEMKQLIVPDFQREIVWPNPAKTRFIDSLIKQLPIPSMCISYDYKTEERLIIDGLQRISSILAFLDTKKEFKLSKLRDIEGKISGKTNIQIFKEHKKLFDRVQNISIPMTVRRCDRSKKNHEEYLFTIFHRLNTGGLKLTNQEIRNCLYYGKFNNLLKDLVKEDYYRNIYGVEPNKIYRFAHEEMALRFIAFSEKYENYRGRLAIFLNEFMDSKSDVSDDEIRAIKEEFEQVHRIIREKITLPEDYDNLSKAIHEALYVGIQRNIPSCLNKSNEEINTAFNNLIIDQLFSAENLKAGLSDRAKVIERLTRAIEIFN